MASETRDIDSLFDALDTVRFLIMRAREAVTIARMVFSIMFHMCPDRTDPTPERMAVAQARAGGDIGL